MVNSLPWFTSWPPLSPRPFPIPLPPVISGLDPRAFPLKVEVVHTQENCPGIDSVVPGLCLEHIESLRASHPIANWEVPSMRSRAVPHFWFVLVGSLPTRPVWPVTPVQFSEPLGSPASVGQSAGIWRLVAGKWTRAPWSFPFTEARTDKRKATSVCEILKDKTLKSSPRRHGLRELPTLLL